MGSFVFMVSRGVSVVCRVANQNDPIIRLMLLTKKWDHCYYGITARTSLMQGVLPSEVAKIQAQISSLEVHHPQGQRDVMS